MDHKSAPAETKLIGIIRDKDGNPRFDDPNNVPPEVLAALTPKDIEYLKTLRNE